VKLAFDLAANTPSATANRSQRDTEGAGERKQIVKLLQKTQIKSKLKAN